MLVIQVMLKTKVTRAVFLILNKIGETHLDVKGNEVVDMEDPAT